MWDVFIVKLCLGSFFRLMWRRPELAWAMKLVLLDMEEKRPVTYAQQLTGQKVFEHAKEGK